MRLRRAAVAIAAGTAAILLVRRRRGAGRGERVDVWFADGSMLSLPEGPETERLLAAAREALAAARP